MPPAVLAPDVEAAGAAGVDARRAVQVARSVVLNSARRDAEARLERGLCPDCGFPKYIPPAVVAHNAARVAPPPRPDAPPPPAAPAPMVLRPANLCVCASITPLPCVHKVTALVHATELGRHTSTHQILVAGLRHSAVRVWQSAETPSVAAAWEEAVAECAVSGRTPVMLYPSRDAIPAATLFRALSPERQAAGLHVLVLDGTWNNVKPMARTIPADATKVVIEPPRVCTLFSPLRAQPSPGRVSTVEAVACLFDELRVAQRLPRSLAPPPVPAPAGEEAAADVVATPTTEALLVASAVRAASAAMVEADATGPDLWGSRLRYYLMVWVDACLATNGKLGAPGGAGTGYQTWYLAPSAGPFARLPARLVTHIAGYAYGADAVCTGHLDKKLDLHGSAHWRALLDAAAASGGGGGGGGAAAAAATAAAAAGGSSAGTISAGVLQSSARKAVLPPSDMPGSGVAWFVHEGVPRRRGAYRRLPFPTPFTRLPLALTCLELLRLEAGVHSGSWTQPTLAAIAAASCASDAPAAAATAAAAAAAATD